MASSTSSSVTNVAPEAQAIQERLEAIRPMVRMVQNERDKGALNLNLIARSHEKIRQQKKISPHDKTKLVTYYSTALADAEREEEALKNVLQKIYEIRTIRAERRLASKMAGNQESLRRGALMKMLQTASYSLPLYVGKKGMEPPPLCGGIPAEPSYIARRGEMVAALVRSPEGDENWILAEVLEWNASSGKYDVEDIDVADEEQSKRHTLSKRRVIPLPKMRADPITCPEALFPKGTNVLAIYPQTTCFYKAVVDQVPSIATEDYEVSFEDSQYVSGFSPPLPVGQRYLICVKERKPK